MTTPFTAITHLAQALPTIGFDRPMWLLLIVPTWAALWLISRRSLAGGGGARQAVHLLIRFAVVALLACTLAHPVAHRRATDVAVIAIVDVSDSVPQAQRHLTFDFLSASLGRRLPGDRFGQVIVARSALVQALPSPSSALPEQQTLGDTKTTNLESGLELARATLPSDTGGRLLLISDGNQTAGSLASAAARLAADGTPVDIATIEYNRSDAVTLESVLVPAWARDADTIGVRVLLQSRTAATGRLWLLLNGVPIDLSPGQSVSSTRVILEPGLNVLTQRVRLPAGSTHRFEAVFEPEDEAAAEADAGDLRGASGEALRAEAVTFTSGRGRVLVLAEDPLAVAPWLAAVSSDSHLIELRSAAFAPTDPADWAGFDAVVLFDQPASAFSQVQHRALERYVHDSGGGLLVVGGPNAFGAGGWIGSPLAEALPVLLDVPQKRQIPKGALALVIDCSGSMSELVAGSGMTQQEIANEAAMLGIQALSHLDDVTVVAFSGEAEVVVPLTRRGNPANIGRQVRSIGSGGGTNLFPAVTAAAEQLAKSDAGLKHIIILTDGQTGGDYAGGVNTAERLRRHGVTISTVGIGDSSNDPLLVQLAHVGGGRFHSVRSEHSRAVLPQVFIKEAQTVRRNMIWEGDGFVPAVESPGEAMRGVPFPLPPVTGYVVTADRGGLSTVAMRGPERDPILAQWNYGLGRATAFTSDAAARWNAAWLGTSTYGTFWLQQIKWVMRPSGDANARIGVDVQSERARVALELLDSDGEPLNFASIRARVQPPDATTDPDTPSSDVVFRQVAPGRYEAAVDGLPPGASVLALRYEAPPSAAGGPRRTGSVRAAIVRRGNEESRAPRPDTRLMRDLAQKTGGQVFALDRAGADLWVRERLRMPRTSRSVWILAALATAGLFLTDVAARRLAIEPRKALMWAIALGTPAPRRAAGPQTATLATVKARAAAEVARQRAEQSDPKPRTPPDATAPAGTAARAQTIRTDAHDGNNPLADVVSAPPTPSQGPPPHAAKRSADRAEADFMSRLRAAKKRSRSDDQPEDSSG